MRTQFLLPTLLLLPLLFAGTSRAEEPAWQTSFAFDQGRIWQFRIPVKIENTGSVAMAGHPVAVDLDMKYAVKPGTMRVARSSDGQEIVYGLGSKLQPSKKDAKTQTYRQIVFIPVDAEPGETVRYDVYLDPFNDACRLPEREVPQYRSTIENGGFENGDGEPKEWRLDEQTPRHRISWSTEGRSSDRPRSGKRCVKTVVDEGAEPSWIAARQSGVRVKPGAKYRLSGYVKAENLNGSAGWYAHVGPEDKPFTISPMASTTEKNFDWKQVEVEFTVPADARILSLGTVLRGTGTAWHDDVTLELLDETATPSKVRVGEIQQCPLTVFPSSDNFIIQSTADNHNHPKGYECRSTFRLVNPTDAAIAAPTVLFDLRASFAHGRLGLPEQILVKCSDGTRVPGRLIDSETRQAAAKLTEIPANSVNYIHVYYKIGENELKERAKKTGDGTAKPAAGMESSAHPEMQQTADPYAGLANLLDNGGFENAKDGRAAGWSGDGVIETDPEIVRFGKQCLRLDMGKDDDGTWRGTRRKVAVEGGRSYLVSGYLRCKDMPGGARIHIHFHDAEGKLCKAQGMSSVARDIRGTTDWTRCSQVLTVPKDAATMELHLTANQPGTLWHDNLTVLDSILAEFVDVKSFYPPFATAAYVEPRNQDFVKAWQFPAVMKVFPQTLPPVGAKQAEQVVRLSAARNEKEPLQLAVRTFSAATLKISELRDEKDRKLPAPEICTVGCVPIDYPTNYYNDTAPKWYRKRPVSAPGCDGWPGMWPDPVIPGATVDRNRHNARETDAFWATWSIPKDAAPGVYRGTLTVTGDDKSDKIPPIPVEFTVYDFMLPDESGVSATYDARFTGPGGIWDNNIHRRAADLMGAHRLEVDSVHPAPGIAFKDGKFTFDWAAFDKAAAHLFDDLNTRYVYTPQAFYCFGWGHPPGVFFGEKPYEGEWPFKDADRSKLRPEYKARYQAALREFWNHVKEKGWADRFVLYISDEPNHWNDAVKKQMIALSAMIHEVDPAIPIYCSTWGHVPEWDGSLDVWGIGHYGIVPVETMEAIRQRGDRIWFTTDGMLCLDTPYSAIERLLPHYCYKYDAEAYEFWGIGWLTHDPWKYGFHSYIHQSSTPGEYYWVRYPNGDGYLLYPGPVPGVSDPEFSEATRRTVKPDSRDILTSIRFEQAREGVEDYEYLRLLAERIEKAAKDKPDSPELVEARAAMADALSLVESPCAIGRYATRILPDPYRLMQIRDRIAKSVEALKPTP